MSGRDSFDLTPQQYHVGLDKLWKALGLAEAQDEDVFTLAAREIERLRLSNQRQSGKRFRMKIYYAHCTSIFDTPREKRDIELLESLGFEVFNPNVPDLDKAHNEHGIEYFRELIQGCDALAFGALPDGKIPAGVYKEIMWAVDVNLPVVELPHSLLQRGLSVDATREYLHDVGQR